MYNVDLSVLYAIIMTTPVVIACISVIAGVLYLLIPVYQDYAWYNMLCTEEERPAHTLTAVVPDVVYVPCTPVVHIHIHVTHVLLAEVGLPLHILHTLPQVSEPAYTNTPPIQHIDILRRDSVYNPGNRSTLSPNQLTLPQHVVVAPQHRETRAAHLLPLPPSRILPNNKQFDLSDIDYYNYQQDMEDIAQEEYEAWVDSIEAQYGN
jgi:hypothetical protein